MHVASCVLPRTYPQGSTAGAHPSSRRRGEAEREVFERWFGRLSLCAVQRGWPEPAGAAIGVGCGAAGSQLFSDNSPTGLSTSLNLPLPVVSDSLQTGYRTNQNTARLSEVDSPFHQILDSPRQTLAPPLSAHCPDHRSRIITWACHWAAFQLFSMSAFPPPSHFRFQLFPFPLLPIRRIIARLFVMGGTNAQFAVGKVSLPGHRVHPRTLHPPSVMHAQITQPLRETTQTTLHPLPYQ